MVSLKAEAISGLFWTYSQQFGVQAIQFGVSLILARLISPEEFGLIGMITIFISLGSILFDGGLTSSLIRTQAVEDIDYSTVFIFNIIASFIIYLIIFLCAPLISAFFKQTLLTDILRVYSLTFIISSFASVQNTKLTKELKFKILAISALPGIIVGSFVGIVLALQDFGVWALVYSFLVQALITTITLWIISKWKPSLQFSKNKFKQHFLYGSKLTMSGILDVVFTNIYQVIIGKFYTPAQVGFYTRANTLMMLPVGNISSALNKVVFPLFSQLQDDLPRLRNLYKRIMIAVIFVVSPIIVVMAVLAKPLITLLFGDKWLPVVPIFQIIAVTGILYPLHLYNLLILQIRGKSGLFLKLEIAKKILMVLVIAATITSGLDVLLWGLVVFSFLALLINTYYAGIELNYSGIQQMQDIFPIFVLSAAMGLVIFSIEYFFDLNNLLQVIIGFLVGTFFYLAVGKLFKFDSLTEFINIIKRK
ncbi:lipopolysaccharide biosynthesis protein [Chryseobacterium wangxinyae]|uniref:lipopolysaccharide biosynthesis protein n=1 Tax=Chryseobacterium sp. CY353 TaxID=2997334 RepID=UPI00226DD886|nr:lipopolysaccharide biosynthesis protein [Chryseobacterium sp. CY353]MCY0970997.1 lipopolysaccharide biosynthesis protein [Chryseobacterium sp. CY353]